jgi:hypothetical protein
MPIQTRQSFSQQLRDSAQAARLDNGEDAWEEKLRKLKGKVGHDGIERISSNDIFDDLEVPMRSRETQWVRLSRVMNKLGWKNIRARGLNPSSYRDRVRGYAREVPDHPETMKYPNRF